MTSEFIYKIMNRAIEEGASDIHLTDRIKPILRIDGDLYELSEFEINNPKILNDFAREILEEDKYQKYVADKNIDASFEHNDMRFRIHIYRQRNCDAFSLRLIPKKIPLFSSMNLPPVINKFAYQKNGLVLITGITGSGKSTTLASLIGEINTTQRKHIITIEDPIEFIHDHKTSIINQREVGTDVLSFSDAVRSAMREDPDILLVGELRDVDTIANAITMSETGHLVFGTLHTRSVPESIDRIIDVFPPGQQEQIRIQLANSISGIVTQELLPKLGGGRVPLCEIMVPNDAIRNLIRMHSSPNSILDAIQTTSKTLGGQVRTAGLADLVSKKLISYDYALTIIDSTERDDFDKQLRLSINMQKGGN